MKRTLSIAACTTIVGLFMVCCGHKKTTQQAIVSTGRTPGWSVMNSEPKLEPEPATVEDTIPDDIPVIREWKVLDSNIYYGIIPSERELLKWKAEFESANAIDSVWYIELDYYKDMGHYVAVQDFIELLHGPKCENYASDDRRLLWRLDQFDPIVEQKPQSGFEKIQFIRGQYERLLDYDLGSQWDMTLWAWLSTDFRDLYGRVLKKEILAHASSKSIDALKAEFKCEDSYNRATSNAFQMIEGSPEWSGSSFPYRVGCYGIPNIDMGNLAKEEVLHVLYDSSYVTENDHMLITKALIGNEYTLFADTLEEDEYTYTMNKQKEALNKDRSSFFAWMDARASVSAKLDGKIKIVYDNSTQSIMRIKLILLKNRYNLKDGYCLPSVEKYLLDNNCSDEELLSHNLEKLTENE